MEDLRPSPLTPISFGHSVIRPAFRASSLRFALLPPTHPPVALRRLEHAGRSAGEPRPASGVAASGTQRGPGRSDRTPVPDAASEPVCGSPPVALWGGAGRKTENEEKEEETNGRREWVGRKERGGPGPIDRRIASDGRNASAPHFEAYPLSSPLAYAFIVVQISATWHRSTYKARGIHIHIHIPVAKRPQAIALSKWV